MDLATLTQIAAFVAAGWLALALASAGVWRSFARAAAPRMLAPAMIGAGGRARRPIPPTRRPATSLGEPRAWHPTPPRREAPSVLVAGLDKGRVDALVERLSDLGLTASPAYSASGCLRMATAKAPDAVLLGADMPAGLDGLLAAHPAGTDILVLRVSEAALGPASLHALCSLVPRGPGTSRAPHLAVLPRSA